MSKTNTEKKTPAVALPLTQGRSFAEWKADMRRYHKEYPHMARLGWATGIAGGGIPTTQYWRPSVLLEFKREVERAWQDDVFIDDSLVFLLYGNSHPWSVGTLYKALSDMVGRRACVYTADWMGENYQRWMGDLGETKVESLGGKGSSPRAPVGNEVVPQGKR